MGYGGHDSAERRSYKSPGIFLVWLVLISCWRWQSMRIKTYASSYSTEVEWIFNVWWLSVQRETTLENLTDPYDHETIWTNFKIGSGCFQKNENKKKY